MMMCGAVCGKSARTVLGGARRSDSPVYLTLGKYQAEYYGLVYLRFGRAATPTLHDENYRFEIGKGEVLKEGKDVAIIATGILIT
jgi:transketolase C-terminal domain/subunit